MFTNFDTLIHSFVVVVLKSEIWLYIERFRKIILEFFISLLYRFLYQVVSTTLSDKGILIFSGGSSI